MGTEFLRKTRKTHRKSIDAGRVRLGTPNLFTQMPTEQPRSALASIDKNAKLGQGEKVIVEPNGSSLFALKGNRVVGIIKNPPADIMRAISKHGGVAKGQIQKINTLSNTADISIC